MTVDVNEIDACLPQTQCARCGYPRCIDYAQAMVEGKSDINRCPPGGEETISALAQRFDREKVKIAADLGGHRAPRLARIVESDCIGCTLCIQACPVDAIVGASKLMHTVINSECTGCELCVPVCPMDCIELDVDSREVEKSSPWRWFDRKRVARARQRNHAHVYRSQNLKKKEPRAGPVRAEEREQMQADILAAVERVRRKRKSSTRVKSGLTLPVTVK